MNKHKNAPAEQAQNLSEDYKTGTLKKDFEYILAATSDYYSEALEKLANGEPPCGDERPNGSSNC